MAKLVRQLLDRAAGQRPAATIPLPRRGDHVEAWLRKQRDDLVEDADAFNLLNNLLHDYQLHADTGTPLHEHCCEGGNVDDCAGCYDAKEAQRG